MRTEEKLLRLEKLRLRNVNNLKENKSTTKPSAVLNKHQKTLNASDDDDDGRLQHREISNDECAACFGQWEDDAVE